MKLATFSSVFLVLGVTSANAGAQDISTLDPATRQEIHRQRLATEYLLLEDARTQTFGSDFGVEGRLLTLRLPLYRWSMEDPAASLWGKRRHGLMGADSAPLPTQDDVVAELPPFRLTLGGENSTVNAELGAIEMTLGQGALVNRYVNNPRSGFDLSTFGLVLGAKAKALGGHILLGNLLQPGRFVGFNVQGRPIQWLAGTYTNFQPELIGNVDMYSLLMSSITVGLSAAVDSDASTIMGDHALSGDYSLPNQMPATAGGLSVEIDAGINHQIIDLHVFANATMLGRAFEEATIGSDGRLGSALQTTNLWGAGMNAGGRFNVFLELVKLGGLVEYRLAGPNYQPTYFDRYYEGDRIFVNTASTTGPKIMQRSMGRHGYNLQLGAQVLKSLGVFVELSDLLQLDPRFGKNDASMRAGGIVHLFGVMSFLGAYVNRGFQNYGKMMSPGTSSLWLGEARLSILFFNLVARKWRSYDPTSTGGYQARDGNSLMAELVIGIL
jgi:hypothetical protein